MARSLFATDIVTSVGPVVDARAYGPDLDDVTLQAAITGIGAVNRTTLLVPPGNWDITNDVIITNNIHLKVEGGAVLDVAVGKTLTINGSIDAGLYTIFSGAGSVAINKALDLPAAWWGFDIDASGAVNAAAIQSAIDSYSGGHTVRLHAGIFTTAPDVITLLGRTNITIRGASHMRGTSLPDPGTRLLFTTGAVGIYMSGGLYDGYSKVCDLHVHGNSVLDAGIKLGGAVQTVEDVTVSHCRNAGIWMCNYSTVCTINRVTATSCTGGTGYALYMSYDIGSNSTNKITNCRFQASVEGIRIESALRLSIDCCAVESNSSSGINIYKRDGRSVSFVEITNSWFEDNGSTGYCVIINSQTQHATDCPNDILFRSCVFMGGPVNGMYVNFANVSRSWLEKCYFAGGDSANGLTIDTTYSRGIHVLDRRGLDNWYTPAGKRCFETQLALGTTPGFITSGINRATNGRTQTFWFGIDTITAATANQVCRPTVYAIGGLTMAPPAYPIFTTGALTGIIAWRTDLIAAGIITIRPYLIAVTDGFGGAVANLTIDGGAAVTMTMNNGDGAYLSEVVEPRRFIGVGAYAGGAPITAGKKLGVQIDADAAYVHTTNSYTLIGLVVEY